MTKKKKSKKKLNTEEKVEDTAEVAEKVVKKNENRGEIEEIYGLSQDENVDMTKLDQKATRKTVKKVVISLLVLFILAAASVAGFFVFNKDFSNTQKSKAELKINTVQSVGSGEAVELEITYENKEDVAIKEGVVSIHYPSGFYFQKADPQPNMADNSWNIANIAAGAGGKIKITGQLVGELNEQKEFVAFFDYKPINFNSTFQTTANTKISLNKSIVDVQAELPQVAFSGQEIEYKVKFKNTSSLPLSNVKVTLDMSKDFNLQTTDPQADLNNNIWQFSNFDSQSEQEIKIKGTISGESKENKEFKFQLGLEEPNGFYNAQVEKSSMILIINPSLKLNLDIPANYQPGDNLDLEGSIENDSDITIKNIEPKLIITDGFTDQSEIILDTISELSAGQKQDFKKQLSLKKKISDSLNVLKATLSINKAQVEGFDFNFKQTAEAESRMKAELKFTSQARYYSDDLTKIGSGPLPPQVGQTTSYVLMWDIKAKDGAVKDIEIVTTIPEAIDELQNLSDGMTYDKKTKQLSWKISSLSANEAKSAQFTVVITPSSDQFNKLLVLTKETVVSAIDTNTQASISQKIEKITSDLPSDSVANGKGVVVN